MRTLRVVQQLAAAGWDVTVVTSDPRTFRPGTPVDEALLGRVPENVRVVRAPVFRGVESPKGLVKRRMRKSGPGTGPAPAGERPPATPEPDPGCVGDAEARFRWPDRAFGAARKKSALSRLIDVLDAALAIPDHEAGWVMPAIRQGLAASWGRRPDVLYSSAPPWTGQIVARALAVMLRCPWVADFRDPWSRAPWRGDRFRFAIRAAAMLERLVVRRADRILFVARGNCTDFAGHYGPRVASKFRVIPNGCDPREFEALTDPPAVPHDTFVLLHAGSLYAGRSPVPLLRAIAAAVRQGVVDVTRFRLRFLGQVGLTSFDLMQSARELGLEEIIELVPRVPREQSLQAMRSASCLLLLQPGHTVSVPGKLYEYLASGRPILSVAEEGETADTVRRSGLGVSVTPENEAGLVEALARVMGMARGKAAMPPRELYDGMLGAAEAVRILDAMARGNRYEPGEAPVEAAARRAHTR